MYERVIAIIFVAIALILGILVTIWPQARLADVVYISRFFDVMLPVLAVGALVKFLLPKDLGNGN